MSDKTWARGGAIKNRRKALGLSLEDVGAKLGVSKAYMSYVESDERTLTEIQAEKLAIILGMPVDLLLLASGRLPNDVQQVVATDAVAITATVRQQREQQIVNYPTELQFPLPIVTRRDCKKSPLEIPDRISVTKTKSSYRAHSYHTKVPPDAIVPFIRALSEPGDVVLDLFSGSGMTGVAALNEGRNAILSDLSPAAVHISRNYTTPCDLDAFRSALARVAVAVEPTIQWLYRPLDEHSNMIEYTTWSDIFKCPSCSAEVIYWDAVHSPGSTDSKGLTCSQCAVYVKKSELKWVGETPVKTHVSAGSARIKSHTPTKKELDLIAEIDATPIPYWVPNVPFGPDREMWRASHTSMGITDVTGFFTRRNLHALAALRHTILTSTEGRTREALMFAFTACVNRASRRYQWNAKRPTNVMTGTLYISSLRYEWNVWSLFKRKAADVLRYYEAFPKTEATVQVLHRSATDLSCVSNGSVAMIFMDPPFGSNIFYSDSSILWEAWLGTITDGTEEIVVNKSRGRVGGGKTLDDYGQLMTKAFNEASRVLTPDGYAVLAFSNSDDRVWLEIQKALTAARLETVKVHILDKGQPSIKGVKGVTGKEEVTTFDLLLTLKHRQGSAPDPAWDVPAPENEIDHSITVTLQQRAARTDEIYSSVIRSLLANNRSLVGITMRKISVRCAEMGYKKVNGKWMSETTAPHQSLTQSIGSPDAPKNLQGSLDLETKEVE